jgi:hypothetical protein
LGEIAEGAGAKPGLLSRRIHQQRGISVKGHRKRNSDRNKKKTRREQEDSAADTGSLALFLPDLWRKVEFPELYRSEPTEGFVW